MTVKILELAAFFVSAAALCFGAVRLLKNEAPKYFKFFVCAEGCYVLEELWVIVNSLFGNGAQDGLVTVRLFGLFGCFCFMLSANVNEFDRVVDDGENTRARLMALAAPAALTAIFALYAFSSKNTLPQSADILGFLSISPALLVSYFDLKHLLLPRDAMGYLETIKGIDILSLAFFAGNYIYPSAELDFSRVAMSVYDLVLALMLAVILIMCERGAKKWKALT